ncbi:hypothetical protein [Escherichia phage vB_EcoM_JNE01]|nr:hypothetical protein [Escherichia phage vB_EcoM_JNE01]
MSHDMILRLRNSCRRSLTLCTTLYSTELYCQDVISSFSTLDCSHSVLQLELHYSSQILIIPT